MSAPTYSNASDNLNCSSAGRTVSIGNVGLETFNEPDTSVLKPATTMLAIDVISAPGTSSQPFHFVTLELVIESPPDAMFVNHSGRENYHREILADLVAPITPDPDTAYWLESNGATSTLRLREDETALLSGPGNGRTYYVGIAGALA